MPIQGSLGGSSSFAFGKSMADPPPPVGYTRGANGKHYKYYSTAQSFSVAQTTCNSEGGWLAVPLNSLDNAAIRAAALSANPVSVWLGLTDTAVEGTWKITSSLHRLTGQNAPYLNWSASEPNNSGDEDYVEMYIAGVNSGLWNDATAVNPRVFVGEWYV